MILIHFTSNDPSLSIINIFVANYNFFYRYVIIVLII